MIGMTRIEKVSIIILGLLFIASPLIVRVF